MNVFFPHKEVQLMDGPEVVSVRYRIANVTDALEKRGA
jgi:hypothetical protein